MGSGESRLNVSFIVWDMVTRVSTNHHLFKEKKSRGGIEPTPFCLPAERLNARPNRLTVLSVPNKPYICGGFPQLYVNELTACKQRACSWAHNHSLYLYYFVLNKFLFKPKSLTVSVDVKQHWTGPCKQCGQLVRYLLAAGVGLGAADVLWRAFRGLDAALGHLDTAAPWGGEPVHRLTHRVVWKHKHGRGEGVIVSTWKNVLYGMVRLHSKSVHTRRQSFPKPMRKNVLYGVVHLVLYGTSRYKCIGSLPTISRFKRKKKKQEVVVR